MQSREGVDGLGTAAWKWTQGRARSKERGRRERMAGLWLRGGRKGERGGRAARSRRGMGWGCAGNQLGAEGGRAVANQLPHLVNLAHLDLSSTWWSWQAE